MERKITFYQLNIEITRKCNFKCAHCYRGEAQDVDISNDDIDALLDQTEMIQNLLLTGGEPFINIDTIEYLFEQIYKRNIPVLKTEIITNGSIINDRLKRLLFEYADYCDSFKVDEERDIPVINIGVSVDIYHMEQGFDSEVAYWKMKMFLYHPYICVNRLMSGNFVVKTGRARNIEDNPYNYPYKRIPLHKRRIELLSNECQLHCPDSKGYQLYYPEQVYVPCSINVDAHGQVSNLDSNIGSQGNTWGEVIPLICNVNDDIYASIIKSNEGRIPCMQFESEYRIEGTVYMQEKRYENAMNAQIIAQKNAIISGSQRITRRDAKQSMIHNWVRIKDERDKRIK